VRQGFRGRVIRLKGLWIQPRDGKPFYRTRKGGKVTLIPLPDLPHDHPDFIAAWSEAARTQKAPEKPKAGTIASTWNAILASDTARLWSDTYRAKMTRHAQVICGKAGHVQARAVKEAHVRADMLAASVPADRLRAWRVWGSWCADRGLIAADPTRAVRPPKAAKGEGHPPWTADHIAAYRARWPVGTAARAAMELLFWTGARISDAVLIGPQMVGRDGVLAFRQSKTGDMAYVPWSCALPDYAAGMDADRQMMLAAIAPFAGQLAFLPTQGGRPRSAKALGMRVQKACGDAGIPVSAHGLRKARAIALIEGGATPHQCGAWTGHQTLAEVVRYARKMDRRKAVTGTAPEPQMEAVPAHVETGTG
jgi:integrase/recombinase XerD